MKKIVIIGSNGAGKTTLANQLSHVLKIKTYHLDRLFWRPDWKGIDRETRIDILQNLTPEKQWIIEGTYLKSSGPRLQTADVIIFLDTPWLVCFLRILERYCKYSRLSRRDIPEGCTVNLTLPRLFKVLIFPLQERRELQKILSQFPEKVFRLRSAKEVKDFLARPEMCVESLRKAEGNHPSYGESLVKTLKVASLKHLVLWLFEELAQGVKHAPSKLIPFVTRNTLLQASNTPKIDEGDAHCSIPPDFDALREDSYNPQDVLLLT